MSDLERSLRFYCEGLGFEKAESHAIGSEFTAALMDLPDVTVTSQFIRKGTTAIELLAFAQPAPFGDGERRAVNQLGLTHLSFRVDDVNAVAPSCKVAWSSSAAPLWRRAAPPSTTSGVRHSRFVYCTDPDGVRVESADGPVTR